MSKLYVPRFKIGDRIVSIENKVGVPIGLMATVTKAPHPDPFNIVCANCNQVGDIIEIEFEKPYRDTKVYASCSMMFDLVSRGKPKCSSCSVELSAYLDAYYGDPKDDNAGRCSKCRSRKAA